MTGALAFAISPIADNLTTALLMGAVVMAVGGDSKQFVALACINVVVAANAGGAFSPFGDITTLMVWQKAKVQFSEFFNIFLPSLVNWLIPAVVMSLAIEKGVPKTIDENVQMKYGAKAIMAFFLVTIATAVCFHNFLHLPPVAGMMLGLGFLGPLSYHIKRHEGRSERYDYILGARGAESVYPITTIVKSKLDLSAIMEKVSLPAFAIDTHHTITHWNKACEAFTGINAQEVIGTRNQWKPFYESEQPVMADLVLNYMPEKMIDQHYEGHFKRNEYIEGAYEASRFVPTLGKEGRWVSFSGAPLKDNRQPDRCRGSAAGLYGKEGRRPAFRPDEKNCPGRVGHPLVFLRCDSVCGGAGPVRLPGSRFPVYVPRFRCHECQRHRGFSVRHGGQHPGDVRRAYHGSGHVPRPMAAGDPDRRRRRQHVSIGSAAGVALMGTARGTYTFGAHLKWTPVIMPGYSASIACHLFLYARLM